MVLKAVFIDFCFLFSLKFGNPSMLFDLSFETKKKTYFLFYISFIFHISVQLLKKNILTKYTVSFRWKIPFFKQ